MASVRKGQTFLLMALLAMAPALASRTHRPATAGHAKTISSKRARRTRATLHGQRTIDAERATEIQQALIRQNYLTGSPSGQWDEKTQAAMQRYQADHGWQTRLMPDSRALISLGLGPAGDTATVATVHKAPSDSASLAEPSAEPEANSLAAVHSISQ